MEVSGSGDGRTVVSTYHPSSAIAERTRWVEGNAPVREAFAYRTDGLLAQMMREGGEGNSKDLTYAYDANGNRTSDERGQHSFNARDQLVAWERGEDQPEPGTHVSYVLNGDGAIVEKRDDGETTRFTYNGERLMSVSDEDTRSTYRYDDFGCGGVEPPTRQVAHAPGARPCRPAVCRTRPAPDRPPSPRWACSKRCARRPPATRAMTVQGDRPYFRAPQPRLVIVRVASTRFFQASRASRPSPDPDPRLWRHRRAGRS